MIITRPANQLIRVKMTAIRMYVPPITAHRQRGSAFVPLSAAGDEIELNASLSLSHIHRPVCLSRCLSISCLSNHSISPESIANLSNYLSIELCLSSCLSIHYLISIHPISIELFVYRTVYLYSLSIFLSIHPSAAR